jgi:predicted nucleic acid-binding protein
VIVTISGIERERHAYLDSSALVKLVAQEPESDALRRMVGNFLGQASSELAVVEVGRRARKLGAAGEAQALRVLTDTELRAIDREVLELATKLDPLELRSLDAIHLATALSLEPLDAFISYDLRLNEAARAAGLNVLSPA